MTVDHDLERRVRAIEFELSSDISVDELKQACREISVQCKRVGFHRVLEAEPSDQDPQCSMIFLVEAGTTVGVLGVSWEEAGRELRVHFNIEDYLVTQTKIFGFVPVGSQKALALPAFERFSSLLQAHLAG